MYYNIECRINKVFKQYELYIYCFADINIVDV